MYAVIAIQGHQYIVQEGDQLVVDQLAWKKWDKVSFDTVVLAFEKDGKTTKVGTPYIDKAWVDAKILEQKKGDKIRVFKFQWKKRYQKTRGFRPCQTVLSIDKIRA
jgi:large subunit ribosomal protein L21